MSILGPMTDYERPCPLRVAVLGCSGSVGRQALSVCRAHPDKLKVVALSVFKSTEALVAYAREFDAAHVAIADEAHAQDPILDELPDTCELRYGKTSVSDLATLDDVDCLVVGIVGEGGIWASYQGIVNDKLVACANKESLVSGGDLLMPLVRPGRFIPVDSEHNAIYQCLLGETNSKISRIWLTCSGGPFFGRTRRQLENVTVSEALAHPNWEMGPKITIDSATLMNKGLEVIEAHHLFDVPMDDIEVLVHRQSRIHSMVEFEDSSVKAQLGPSDMRVPLQFALSWPERWQSSIEPVDFLTEGPLSFDKPDLETFRCLELAYDAGRAGGTLPCAMNAANEVANLAFRQGEIGFSEIDEIVERVMNATDSVPVESLTQLAEVNRRGRALARDFIEEMRG